MNAYIILSAVYLLYLAISYFFVRSALRVKSPFTASIFTAVYFVFLYFYFEFLNYVHGSIATTIEDIQAYNHEGMLLLQTLIICVITGLFVTLFVVAKRINNKKRISESL